MRVCAERFDRDASRYHQGVYKRKRLDLIASLDGVLSPLFLGQLKNLHKSALVAFKTEVHKGLQADGYNFADVVSGARARAEQAFVDGARESVVEEGDVAWGWEEERELLREEMRSVGDQLRRDETKKMVNAIEVRHAQLATAHQLTCCVQRNFKRQIAEPVDLALNKPAPDLWDRIVRSYGETLAKAEASYLAKATSAHPISFPLTLPLTR
jgi:hypothetical protein